MMRWRQRAMLVGIDIAPDAVRLLQCGADDTGVEGVHYAREPLPSGAVVEQQIVDSKVVGVAIARAMQRARICARRAALALAVPAVRLRVLTVPSGLTDTDLETRIELEAARIQPPGAHPLHLDFAVQSSEVNRTDEVNVLLAVADPEAVHRGETTVKAAGLSIAAVDLEVLALARALYVLTGQPLALEKMLALARESTELLGLGQHLRKILPAQELAEHASAWLLAYGLALHGRAA